MPWLRSLSLLIVVCTLASAADWPQFLGPNRDGATTEKVVAWKGALKDLWRVNVGEAHSSPIVAAGMVFSFDKDRQQEQEGVTAYKADTGKEVWHAYYDRPAFKGLFGKGPRSTPTFADGRLYTYGPTGILTCFNAVDGKVHWKRDTLKDFNVKNLFFGMSASPLVVGDLVLVNVGGKDASIVAFKKEDGSTAWKSGSDAATYASPIVMGQGDKQQAIFLTAKGLVGIAPKDGKLLWQVPLVDKLNESSTTPVLMDNLLIGTSVTFGSLCVKLDAEGKPEKQPVWTKPELNCYFSTPVAVGKDHLYLVSSSLPGIGGKAGSTLRCVDVQTGKELWNKAGVGKYHAALLRTGDNKLLMMEEAGSLVLLDPDPKGYKELARAKICANTWSHPALADGRLYIRDAKELVCVELPK